MKSAALLGTAIVVWLLGMAGLQTASSSASGQTPSSQRQPSFRSSVDLVEVTVVVRDGSGRLVTDLGSGDIQVLEDGVPQQTAAFDRVAIPIRGEPAAEERPSVPSDVAANDMAAAARVFVLVLDATHVAARRTRDVRSLARQFVEERVGPADFVAVISPGALESATQDFTRDRARLLAAIDQFTGNKLRSATVERDEEARTGFFVLHGGRDPSDDERALRARSLADVLHSLAKHLDRMKGRRKTVLLFTEGLDYDLTDVTSTYQRSGNDVMRALTRAIEALQRTNVAVYPIDPRGLSSAEGDQLEAPLYRPQRPDPNAPTVDTEYGASIRSMRSVAYATGGFAAVDRNELGPAYARIVEEASNYYIVGYSSSKPPKPGETRKIGVLVSRPGMQVSARAGYTVPSAPRRTVTTETSPEPSIPGFAPGRPRGGRTLPAPVEPSPSAPSASAAAVDDSLASLLASPLPHPGLPIRVHAVPFHGDDRRGVVQLVVEVMGKSLALVERSGRFEERIELALLTIDDRGRASNGISTRIDLRLTAQEAERVRTTGVRWLSRLELPPGRHQLRVAGRATRTAATGLTTHEIDVPSFDAAHPGMSGVTLTSLPSVLMVTSGAAWLGTAIPTPPSAARSFVAGDAVTAAVEIYLPPTFQGDADVTARIQWPDGSRSPVGARRVRRGADGTGAIAFAIETTPLPPGRYVLHIALTSPGNAAIDRRVPFEVVAAVR